MINSLITLFSRDLNLLSEEIKSFKNERAIWDAKPGVTNSSGNLCLHLCGNLNHFIGAALGQSGYIRQREQEFSTKNITATELMALIAETKTVVVSTLKALPVDALEKDYPLPHNGEIFTMKLFLMHIHSHLTYHLGQINYLRRIIEG